MLAALALVQTAPASSAPAAEEDVVVIGERLKHWTGRMTSGPFGAHCRTVVSTGDATIDALGCSAMRTCWPLFKPGLEGAQDRRRDPAVRERLRADTGQAFGQCLRTHREALVAALVEKRHAGARVGR